MRAQAYNAQVTDTPRPERTILCAEALSWLAANPAAPRSSVITSLPDVSELPDLGFEGWRAWFIEAARQVLGWLPPEGLAIFFQSDIRHQGTWIDKGYLVMKAAEDERAQLVWHKIVGRLPAGTITQGRASYSHMLCFARTPRGPSRRPGPDLVADAGFKAWAKAMGVEACKVACRYLREESQTELVVDPFCGHGTALAVANTFGFAALGIDRSARQCRAARRLVLP